MAELSIESAVGILAALQPDYNPNPDVQAQLSNNTLVAVVGPFAIGKTTCIELVESLNRDFRYATGFATRPPRAGETARNYRFIGHTLASTTEINCKRETGELIQYVVHPTTGYMYGTELQDYETPYNLIASMPATVESARRISFKNLYPISLAMPLQAWEAHLGIRGEIANAHDMTKRLREAQENIDWSLSQSDTLWVINHPGKPELAARKIIGTAHGLAEQMYSRVKSLLAEL